MTAAETAGVLLEEETIAEPLTASPLREGKTEALIPVASPLKAKAEAVLNELGYSLPMVVTMFLGQIIREGKIPDGVPRPPLSLDVMTPERLGAEIQKGLDDIRAGRTIPWEQVKAEFERDYGIRI